MTERSLDELGPVDYVVSSSRRGSRTHRPGSRTALQLHDSGIIRVMDLVIIGKGEDGTVMAQELGDLEDMGEFARLETELAETLAEADILRIGAAMGPGSLGAVLVYENLWAAGFASAIRHAGGQLVTQGRIPVQAIIAAVEAAKRRSPPKESKMPLRASRLGQGSRRDLGRRPRSIASREGRRRRRCRVRPGTSPVAKAAVVGAASPRVAAASRSPSRNPARSVFGQRSLRFRERFGLVRHRQRRRNLRVARQERPRQLRVRGPIAQRMGQGSHQSEGDFLDGRRRGLELDRVGELAADERHLEQVGHPLAVHVTHLRKPEERLEHVGEAFARLDLDDDARVVVLGIPIVMPLAGPHLRGFALAQLAEPLRPGGP